MNRVCPSPVSHSVAPFKNKSGYWRRCAIAELVSYTCMLPDSVSIETSFVLSGRYRRKVAIVTMQEVGTSEHRGDISGDTSWTYSTTCEQILLCRWRHRGCRRRLGRDSLTSLRRIPFGPLATGSIRRGSAVHSYPRPVRQTSSRFRSY